MNDTAYAVCNCNDGAYTLSAKVRIQLAKDLKTDDVITNAINQLFEEGKIDAKTKKALFETHNAPLQKAVEEGYGKTLAKLEFGTPNYEFLKQLQTNTAVFAMFKNHAAIKETAALLKDKEGNLRSKEDFKKEALKLDKDYRTTKLDAEYDTAVRQARMASQWAKYEKNSKLYPSLRYLLTKASVPDVKHLEFVGIVRPVNDPFWDTHYPPNRWRCQCSVEQTDDIDTDIPGNLPAIPKEFAFNSGKTGQIFDVKDGDYARAATPKEAMKLIKQAKDYFNTDIAAEIPYQTFYTSKSGGSILVHPLTYKESDFNDLVRNARSLANQGMDIKILPAVLDQKLRDALLPAEIANNARTPDFLINNKTFFDAKTMKGTSVNTIKHQFSEIKEQAKNIIIEATEKYPWTKYETIKMLKQKMGRPELKDFGDVWINYKGVWLYNPHK